MVSPPWELCWAALVHPNFNLMAGPSEEFLLPLLPTLATPTSAGSSRRGVVLLPAVLRQQLGARLLPLAPPFSDSFPRCPLALAGLLLVLLPLQPSVAPPPLLRLRHPPSGLSQLQPPMRQLPDHKGQRAPHSLRQLQLGASRRPPDRPSAALPSAPIFNLQLETAGTHFNLEVAGTHQTLKTQRTPPASTLARAARRRMRGLSSSSDSLRLAWYRVVVGCGRIRRSDCSRSGSD